MRIVSIYSVTGTTDWAVERREKKKLLNMSTFLFLILWNDWIIFFVTLQCLSEWLISRNGIDYFWVFLSIHAVKLSSWKYFMSSLNRRLWCRNAKLFDKMLPTNKQYKRFNANALNFLDSNSQFHCTIKMKRKKLWNFTWYYYTILQIWCGFYLFSGEDKNLYASNSRRVLLLIDDIALQMVFYVLSSIVPCFSTLAHIYMYTYTNT